MKKFFSIVGSMKINACISFTAWMLMMTVGYSIAGIPAVTVSMLWQLVALSVIASILQTIAFSELVFRKLRYSIRMLLFCLPFLAALSVFAWKFQWFPTGELISWAIFLGIFLFILVAMTLGFELAFRLMGKRYDGLLGEYHRNQDENSRS